MRVLLPLHNKQSAATEAEKKKQQLANEQPESTATDNTLEQEESEDEDWEETEDCSSSGSESCSSFVEEGEFSEDECDKKEETTAHSPTSQATAQEQQPEPQIVAVVASRKRECPPESASPAAFVKKAPVPTAKRSRLSPDSTASDDSKPAAKPTMVAPKRHPSPSGDRQRLERRRSDASWEENEPTPFGNQNYYLNHPSNSPHLLTAAASSPLRTGSLQGPAASARGRPKNYDDPPNEEEEAFAAELKLQGLEIVEQEGDGNCLFRAVSLQVYGDPSMHAQVREQCLNFMAVNEEHFGQFMTGEPFDRYIARKRKIGVHGNNPEIQAISELFNRPVQVFMPSTGAKPLNIFHKDYKTTDAPIRLSYHDNNHYNAVVDPTKPTAGLGLGLPGLQPGLADKMQVAAATAESDLQSDMEQAIKASQKERDKYQQDQLQRVLKESSYSHESMYKNKAIALSDVDATNFELEQTILETSLQSYFSSSQDEEGRKQKASPTGRRRRPQHSPPSPQNCPLPQQSAPTAAAASASPAVAAAAAPSPPSPEHSSSFASSATAAPSQAVPGQPQSAARSSPYDFPPVVQELVMNGFDFEKVVHAYELVGENFDDLLAFLMSNSAS